MEQEQSLDKEKSMVFTYIDSIDWSKFTINVILGYGVSWVYFFLTASIFIKLFGKAQGYTINYIISWMIWIVAVKLLYTMFPNGNHALIRPLIQ
jgi:hypothetical protein